jgi:hypothetical protein
LKTGFERHGFDVLSRPEFAWLMPVASSQGRSVAGLTQGTFDAIITGAKAAPDMELVEKIARMEDALGIRDETAQPEIMDWEQLRTMTETGLVGIGSHTRRHTRFTPGLEPAVLEDEIQESKRIIERGIGKEVASFCYPNGNMTEAASGLVRASYRAACTTRRGWHSVHDDPFLIRRIGIHEDVSHTRSAFLSRIAGWV